MYVPENKFSFELVPVDLHVKFHTQSTGKKKTNLVYLGLIHKNFCNKKQFLLKEN